MTELRFAGQDSYDLALEDLLEGSLIESAVQDSGILTSGQTLVWQTYYGGSDHLIIIAWQH